MQITFDKGDTQRQDAQEQDAEKLYAKLLGKVGSRFLSYIGIAIGVYEFFNCYHLTVNVN
jgi:hypothetical protein